jgi:lysophospholipase L1-like esterase
MSTSPAQRHMDAYIQLMLEPGAEIDFEAIFASPESLEIRREGEERLRVDWANLGRYGVTNDEVRRGPAPTAVLLGDSITENWAHADPGLFSGGLVNRGIGGQISAQLLVRFFPDVVRLRPRAVHLMVGTNDIGGNLGAVSNETFHGHVTSMLDLADVNGIRVILASIPPSAGFGWKPDLDPAPTIARWNAWLRQIADERGAVYADYFPVLADAGAGLDARLGNDGVHPNRTGYEVMRPVLETALRSLGLDAD